MNLYSRFLGLLTYRQRFLIPAVIFFLFVPYNAYVIIQTFNFWIRQSEWQQEGNTLQQQMNNLLNVVSLRQEQTGAQLLNGETLNVSPAINNSIEEQFKIMMPYETTKDPGTHFLTNGFSLLNDPSIEIKAIEELWKALLSKGAAITFEENNERHQKIVDLLRDQLATLGYSYALFQTRSIALDEYSTLVLVDIPAIEEMIKQVAIKIRLIIASSTDDITTVSEVIALTERIKTGIQKVSNKVQAYNSHLDERNVKKNSHEFDKSKKSLNSFVSEITQFLDVIMNNQSSLMNEKSLLQGVLGAKRELVNELYKNQQPLFENERFVNSVYYYAYLIQLLLATIVIFILIKYHVISNHLEALRDHIHNLAKGQLSHCFTSNKNDEFGIVGKALDKVVEVIGIIMADLILLGKKIEETTQKVTWAVQEQGKMLAEQEEIIKGGKKTAQNIAEKAQFLSNLLNELCESSQFTSQAESASSGLKKMRENMGSLADSSKEFIVKFSDVDELVKNMQKKVNFMDRLGDQAKMLSLNEKIENANIITSAGNFSEITDKTELFSDNSEHYTSQIKKIIKDVSADVKMVRGEAEKCFDEIRDGAAQLNLVSNQLEEIARHGKDQQIKFLEVDQMMKKQASASQKIMDSVEKLLVPTNENTALVQELPNILDDIIQQQKKLTEVVNKMVYIP